MKHLQELIYRMLLEEPMTGYAIAKQIEARTGWKPSWGSIYPQLDNMLEASLVEVEKQGRSKIYSLTTKGEKQATESLEKTEELINEIIERLRVMQGLTGEDLTMSIKYLEAKSRGENPILPLQEESDKFNKILLELWEQGKLKEQAKQINKIIKKARKELESIISG